MISNPGQLIVMGVPGPELNDGLRELITRVQPGGFILFVRNMSTPRQLYDLIAELRGLCDRNPIIAIDQEGGRVSRLRVIGEEPPSARMLALAARADWCREHGEWTGKLLALMGFNLNLAPVVDYSFDEARDNSLRGRCYGANPDEVIERATAFLDGMQAQGVLGTAKHFPGYTFCEVDPHGDLPKVSRTLEEMKSSELRVFAHFVNRAPVFMTGHGLYPLWQRDTLPASLSPHIVSDLLRSEMNFKGVVMTDDLEMGAICNRYRAAAVTRLAINAQADLLLFCHNPACIEISRETLDAMPEGLLAEPLRRVGELKQRLPKPPERFDEDLFIDINAHIRDLREKTAQAAGSREGSNPASLTSPVFGA